MSIFAICTIGSSCGKAPPLELCRIFIDAPIHIVDGKQYISTEDLVIPCIDKDKKPVDRNILALPKVYIASPLEDTVESWKYCKFKDGK